VSGPGWAAAGGRGPGGLGSARWCWSVSGVVSPQVPAVPAGRPAAADLPAQLLHAGGAARRAAARGHRPVPRLHGVSAGIAGDGARYGAAPRSGSRRGPGPAPGRARRRPGGAERPPPLGERTPSPQCHPPRAAASRRLLLGCSLAY